MRSVEDADLALARRRACGRATGSRGRAPRRRDLERRDRAALRIDAPMTWRIVPSLPAASMPCRTIRTARFASAHNRSWRSVIRSRFFAVRSAAEPFSNPNFAAGSRSESRTRWPGARPSRSCAGQSSPSSSSLSLLSERSMHQPRGNVPPALERPIAPVHGEVDSRDHGRSADARKRIGPTISSERAHPADGDAASIIRSAGGARSGVGDDRPEA